MFVTTMIGLNTLIAILGDSFDNVMAEKHLYDMREKVVLLKELNDFYCYNKQKEDLCFMHIIRYVQQEGDNSNAWEGKIKKISNMVNSLGNTMNSKFKAQQDQISKNQASIEKEMQDLKGGM
jgi:hypothetical protein